MAYHMVASQLNATIYEFDGICIMEIAKCSKFVHQTNTNAMCHGLIIKTSQIVK